MSETRSGLAALELIGAYFGCRQSACDDLHVLCRTYRRLLLGLIEARMNCESGKILIHSGNVHRESRGVQAQCLQLVRRLILQTVWHAA